MTVILYTWQPFYIYKSHFKYLTDILNIQDVINARQKHMTDILNTQVILNK